MDLIDAVRSGDIQGVRELLDRGVDPNIQDRSGYTALIFAARGANIEIVELLLNYGADPSIREIHGDTAIMMARRWNETAFLSRKSEEAAARRLVIIRLIQDHIRLQKTRQDLAFVSFLNPRLGDNSVSINLENDIIDKILSYPRRYDVDIPRRIREERENTIIAEYVNDLDQYGSGSKRSSRSSSRSRSRSRSERSRKSRRRKNKYYTRRTRFF